MSTGPSSSFDFLFNSSALHCVARLETSYGDGALEAQGKRLLEFASVVSTGSETRVREAIKAMMGETAYPPLSIEPMPYIQKFAGELSHEMIGSLLRLPYFNILRENIDRKC